MKTPSEVAHAIVYVLQNGKKHGVGPCDASWLDEYSSAARFDGWTDVQIEVAGESPRTWLLRVGYRRARVEVKTTAAPRML